MATSGSDVRAVPRPRDDDDLRQPGLDRAADAGRLPRRLHATCSACRSWSWSGWPTATPRRAAARPTSTCTPRPASATRSAGSSTPRPTSRRCVITAGQQVRAADHDRGEPDQPRRDDRAAAVRQVEPRAAARAGRSRRDRARDPPRHAAAARPGVRLDPDGRLERGGRRGPRAATRSRAGQPAAPRPTPRRSPSSPRRLDGRAANPVLVAGPDIDAVRRLGRGGRAGREAAPAGLGDPGDRRLAARLPRDATRTSSASCRRRSAAIGETLKDHDLVLVVGSSVFPYYPYIPGPLLGRGHRAGGDHQRSRRGRARADGRRDRRRRRRSRCERLVELVGEAERAGARAPPEPGRPARRPTR